MSRSNSSILALLAAVILSGIAWAQESTAPLEQYLTDRGLDDLLAEHLVEALATQSGDERANTAKRLGQLYVRLLDRSQTEEDRKYWSERASNLLRLVPEADSTELRINLSKTAYMRAEAIAERTRLRMASPEETAQAERVLRDTASTFLEIAQAAHLEAQRLERRLSERLDEDAEQRVTQSLAGARQSRSLGFYYAGWSEYYLGLLTGDTSRAGRALRHFGWLLSARDGEEASFDKLQPGLLRYEHVARSAIGAALACSLQGRSVEAVAWLDAIERSTDITEVIRSQLVERRMYVLAKAGMWADLELIVRRMRASGKPLEPILARQLVVTCMDALEGPEGSGRSRELIRRLSETGLAELVAQGEVSHILELVRAYGTASIGETGFVVLYVKGLLALDIANNARDAAGESADDPVESPAIASMYRNAAHQLLASVDEPDAVRNPDERIRALTSAGSAYYYSGDPVLCADVLERAISEARTPELAESAHWLAVVALDDAVESGQESLKPRRNQLVQLYLGQYAGTDRAARLLMRPSSDGLLPDSEAMEILLTIQPTSPNFLAARRQASMLLYRMYRKASVNDRDSLGNQFLDIASQLVRHELAELRSGDVEVAKRASASVVLVARQIADVALGLRTPDIERAVFALDTLDRVANYAALELKDIEPEIAFRRLQIASAQNDLAAIDRWYGTISSTRNSFFTAAQRLLYRDAVARWLDDPRDTDSARNIVRFGTEVLEEMGSSDEESRAKLGVLETVSQAASTLWALKSDRDMLRAAIGYNNQLIESGAGTAGVYRRQARLHEQDGETDEALDAWRHLVAGLEQGTEDWYEARYESIRLLLNKDPESARTTMRQHVTLYPKLGPTPWDQRFRELAKRMNVEVEP